MPGTQRAPESSPIGWLRVLVADRLDKGHKYPVPALDRRRLQKPDLFAVIYGRHRHKRHLALPSLAYATIPIMVQEHCFDKLSCARAGFL